MELVSILMPNFNTEQFVAQAIKSVINQTYPHWELLIVDDGSSDDSVKIIESFRDERINFVALEKNRGPDYVRNLALQKASGRYIAFLDSDDAWEREKLERQVRFMQEEQIAFSYTTYFVINECGERIGSFTPRDKISYQDMLRTCEIGNSTAMYDASMLGKIPSGRLRHDYELWLKILKNGVMAYRVDSIPPPPLFLASIRIRKGSDTSNKPKSAKLQWRVYREVENLSFAQSLFYFCSYCFCGIRKRFDYFGGER